MIKKKNIIIVWLIKNFVIIFIFRLNVVRWNQCMIYVKITNHTIFTMMQERFVDHAQIALFATFLQISFEFEFEFMR